MYAQGDSSPLIGLPTLTGASLPWYLLYVNDLLISASIITDIHTIRDNLRKYYKLKDLGKAKRYLGFNLIRNSTNNTIFITQTAFIKATLKKYAVELINSKALTPWPAKYELPKT